MNFSFLALAALVLAIPPVAAQDLDDGTGAPTASGSYQVIVTSSGGCQFVTNTFEGGGNRAQINPGGGNLIPGSNMRFPSPWLTLVDSDAGGTGNFANEPSPSTIIFYLSGDGASITFDRPVASVSLHYTSPFSGPLLTAYNSSASVVASQAGSPTDTTGAGDPTGGGRYGTWRTLSVDVSGTLGNVISSVTITNPFTTTPTANRLGVDSVQTCELITNQPPEITCNPCVELWSPDHELVDASSSFSVSDPDGAVASVTVRCFSNEHEIPETGDGTGKHAPDFKDEVDPLIRGALVRSERSGKGTGRFYVFEITATDDQGAQSTALCVAAVCPHSEAQSIADLKAEAAAAAAAIAAALPSLPAGIYEHGLSEELGPKQ